MSIDNDFKIPFYAKATIIFVGLFVFIAILYIAEDIIVPLIFATIIAIVLHPLVNFLVRKKINRVFAIVLTMLLTFLVIAGLGLLILSQASRFSESWPALVDNFTRLLHQTVTWVSSHFNIRTRNIYTWIAESKNEIINTSSSLIGQTLLTIGGWLVVLFLVPVYVFLILFYHPLLREFMVQVFGTDNKSRVSEIITETKILIQQYLIGLIIEAIIIAALYTATLFILGVDYAILLGIIGALLNIIPYVGGLVGVALPMIVALATKSTGWYAIYILIIYYFIQLIDNNYIVPKVVASKVKINAFISIIVVIVGNALWGVSGMFLSIPLLAIVKLILDRIETLKPWGFLLGDTMPHILRVKPIRFILKKKHRD